MWVIAVINTVAPDIIFIIKNSATVLSEMDITYIFSAILTPQEWATFFALHG